MFIRLEGGNARGTEWEINDFVAQPEVITVGKEDYEYDHFEDATGTLVYKPVKRPGTITTETVTEKKTQQGRRFGVV